jgi:hypothetical protein
MSNPYRGPSIDASYITEMFPTKSQFIWPSDFREDLKNSSNQKQELSVAAMFDNESRLNE